MQESACKMLILLIIESLYHPSGATHASQHLASRVVALYKQAYLRVTRDQRMSDVIAPL